MPPPQPITLLFARSSRRLWSWGLGELLSGLDASALPQLQIIVGNPADTPLADATTAAAWTSTFLPRMLTLNGLLADLCQRHAGPWAPLPLEAHSLLADDLISANAERWPWLARLQSHGALGRQVAELHLQWWEAGRPSLARLGATRGTLLDDLLASLDTQVTGLPGHRLPPMLLHRLETTLHNPPAALARWLSRHPLVLLAGMERLSPLRLAALTALLRAWARHGCHAILALPCGPAQDLFDATLALGGDPTHPRAATLRTLGAALDLRRHLFQELVARGEARMAVVTAQGWQPVDPAEELPSPEADGLAEALGSGQPCALPPNLRLLRCPDTRAELRAVAREVKEALLDGVKPEDCLVAVADLGARLGPVAEVFAHHGVPIQLGRGRPLVASPVIKAVLRAIQLPLAGFPVEDLLAFLESDLVWTPPPLRARRLRVRCLAAGVVAGPVSAWRAPLEALLRREWPAPATPAAGDDSIRAQARLEAELAALARVEQVLSHLGLPATPAEYRFRVLETADFFRIPSRAGRLSSEPEAVADGLLAWGRFLQLLEDCTTAWLLARPEAHDAAHLARLLTEACEGAEYQAPATVGDRVRVVAPDQLPGRLPPRVWVAGLSRGLFPVPLGPSYLLDRQARIRLVPDSAAWTRLRLGRLLQEAEDECPLPPPRLVLSWPATRDDRPAPPAPALADLLALPDSEGHPLESHAEAPGFPEENPLSQRDLARLAARSAPWRALAPVGVAPLWGWQAELENSRQDTTCFGAWDGLVHTPLPFRDPMPVTWLESYLRCPAQVFYRLLLDVTPWEVHDPDLPAPRRGTLLHRVLERFVASCGAGGPEALNAATLPAARQRLATILDEALQQELEQGAHPFFLDRRRQQWGSGLADDQAPRGLLRAWVEAEAHRGWQAHPVALERAFRDFPLQGVRLQGKVDRVDQTAAGDLVVIDYKTGYAPAVDNIRAGLALQPVVYGEAMARALGAKQVAVVYQELRRPEEIRHRAWVGDTALVQALADKRQAARAVSREEGRTVLQHAATGLKHWRQGLFHTTLADPAEAGCAYCPYSLVCRLDPWRNQQVAAGPQELQRPLTAPAGEPHVDR